ncbi:MAG: Anaerobic sulfite reductase subunit B [Pseudomonadales bacterium]|nr:Anaerobic sulfite reductase subunit B [Pseudomonadales bacterium]
MASLTPAAATIEGVADDSAQARRFVLRLQRPDPAWQHARPGQFFMLSVPGAGEAAFTFLELPDAEGRFGALVRATGVLTRALFALGTGRVVGVRGPFGSPWPGVPAGARLLVIAGGCGLAPLGALLRYRAGNAADATALVYAARDESHAMLGAERARWRGAGMAIDELRDDGETRPQVLRQHLCERIDATLARAGVLPEAACIAGPEAMMRAAAAHLVERGVPALQVFLSIERRMHCAVGNCGHCYVAHSYACREGPTYAYARLLELDAAALTGRCGDVPAPWLGCAGA